MNKKKIASLLLVGTLLVGGGVLGAKAWFTDTAQVKSNLVITTGSLKVGVHDGGWNVKNPALSGSEVTNFGDSNNFENVRPGDSFFKRINISNNGTLKQKINVIANKELPESISKMFDVEIVNIIGAADNTNPTYEHELAPKGFATYDIRLTLKGNETDNNWQNKTIDFAGLNSTPFLTINATQVNATKANNK